MSASSPDFTKLLGIEKDDLLTAMKRLNKIIQSDKQFDVPSQQSTQNFYSPVKNDPRTYQKTSPGQLNNYEDVELLESLKAVANEVSQLDVRNTLEDSVSKAGPNISQYNMNNTMKSQYMSFEKEKKLDKSMEIVDRLYQREIKKKEKLAAMQFQKYKEETATLRDKPEISLNSKILAEQKHKIPIYERSIAIMKQREENINRMRRELEESRLDTDSPTFQPDLSFTKRFAHERHHERSRTPQEFASQVYAWQQKKNEAIQREQYENITRELAELTFKPKINNKSRNIAKKNNFEPVEVRLQKHKEHVETKKQALIQKEKPTFKPVLNERSQNMTRNRKGFGDKSYRLDKSVNLDTSIGEDTRKGTPTKNRSLTPNSFSKRKPSRSPSTRTTQQTQASPKFNEIEYTPAVDFLLKKFE